jgi:DNA-binding NtrC family response regulator
LLPSRDRAQIAIVEDDAIMGESLLQRLTLEGYDARWWQTGTAAVEGLRERRADLVVCDIRLPDMTARVSAGLPELIGSRSSSSPAMAASTRRCADPPAPTTT